MDQSQFYIEDKYGYYFRAVGPDRVGKWRDDLSDAAADLEWMTHPVDTESDEWIDD